jgi:hypothetical protein
MVLRRFCAALLFAFVFAPTFADDMAEQPVPAWPLAGSDADVSIYPDSAYMDRRGAGDENIRIISKIGADLSVENNINIGSTGYGGESFSGGANIDHPYPTPAGFYPYEGQAEMPFTHTEMVEDDGAAVLSMSKSDRKKAADPRLIQASESARQESYAVDGEVDDLPAPQLKDQVRSWVVAAGQTLRDVLQAWCDKEGWDLIWNTPREYPISASAVFKGRFIDVSSALVRNFSRASPIPYAKFYKGNRVLVVSTTGDS